MEHTLLEDAVHPYLREPQAGQPAPDGLMHIVHENDMPPLTNLEEEPRDEVVLALPSQANDLATPTDPISLAQGGTKGK